LRLLPWGVGLLFVLGIGVYLLTQESNDQLLQKANQLTKSAEWPEAFATYKQILVRDASNPQVTNQLIMILDSIKSNTHQQLKTADQFINQKAYVNALNLLKETEEYSPALYYLPNDSECRSLLFELYSKLAFATFDAENYTETKKYYSKALAFDPNNVEMNRLKVMLKSKGSNDKKIVEQLANSIIRHDVAQANLILNKGADHNASYQGNPLLLIAVQENQIETINTMLFLGADPNNTVNFLKSKNANGKYTSTPLLLAVEQNKQKVVQALIERGKSNVDFAVSDPQSGEEQAWSPLRMAVIQGYNQIAAYLIQKKAKINLVYTRSQYTLLIDAARYNQSDALELLLNAGAKVNEVDARGMTALMWAADRDNLRAVQLLLENKANKYIRSNDGFLAKEYTNQQTIKKILN